MAGVRVQHPTDGDDVPDSLPAHPTWPDLPALVRRLVELDVALGEPPRLRVVGGAGADVLGALELPPVPDPPPARLVLRAGLAMLALGADRLAAALPARAWSLDDPVAPVADGVDLRQRVVALTTSVPRDVGPARVRTVLLPYGCAGDDVVWDDPQDMQGAGTGAVPDVLAALLDERGLLDDAGHDERAEAVVACLAGGARLVAPAGSPLAGLAG